MTNLIFISEGNLDFMLSSPPYEKYKLLFFPLVSDDQNVSSAVLCSRPGCMSGLAPGRELGVCWGSASGSMLLAGTVLTFPLAAQGGTSAGVINFVVFRGACS